VAKTARTHWKPGLESQSCSAGGKVKVCEGMTMSTSKGSPSS
jgi:hypothetical protein